MNTYDNFLIRFYKSPVAAVACAARFGIAARLRPFALRFCPYDGFRQTSNGILILLLPERRFYTTSNGILLILWSGRRFCMTSNGILLFYVAVFFRGSS